MDYLNGLMSGLTTDYAGWVAKYQLLIGMVILPLIYFIPRMATWFFYRLRGALTAATVFDESDNMVGWRYHLFAKWFHTHCRNINNTFDVIVSDNKLNTVSGIGSHSLNHYWRFLKMSIILLVFINFNILFWVVVFYFVRKHTAVKTELIKSLDMLSAGATDPLKSRLQTTLEPDNTLLKVYVDPCLKE